LDAGVACLNGAGFGEFGEGYIRFSYANSYENLMQAVERIGAWAVELTRFAGFRKTVSQ